MTLFKATVKGVCLRREPDRWCERCHLRIAAYDLRTVKNNVTYHQHCFLLLVLEEANEQKARQAEAEVTAAARRTSA